MRYVIPLVGIMSITVLEAFAIGHGINGTAMSIALSGIAAIAGGGGVYTWLKKKNGGKK